MISTTIRRVADKFYANGGFCMVLQVISLLGKRFAELKKEPVLAKVDGNPRTKRIGDRNHYLIEDAGISLTADVNCKVRAVFLYSEGYDGFSGYKGNLPCNLSFSDSQIIVHDKLGAPSASGGGDEIVGLGRILNWERYDYDEFSLQIRYSAKNDAIVLLTVISPEFLPGNSEVQKKRLEKKRSVSSMRGQTGRRNG